MIECKVQYYCRDSENSFTETFHATDFASASKQVEARLAALIECDVVFGGRDAFVRHIEFNDMEKERL